MDKFNKVFNYYLLIIFIILGGVTFGYNISIIASALPLIKTQYSATDKIISFLAGLVFAGVMIAKFLMAFLNDIYGRRKTLIFASCIFVTGSFFIIISYSINYILIGRFFQGIGSGLLMATTSLYIVEIANDKTRGSLTALYQLSFTIGLLLANIVGMYLYYINWKISFIVLFFLTIIFILVIYNLPCSPRWLYRNGFIEEAKKALKITHTDLEIDNIIKFWQESHALEQRANIFQLKYFKPLFLVIIITCLHQLTGINAILQTSTILISQAGFTKNAALLSSIGITLVNVLGTGVGLKIIDKFPRNLLLGYCGILIAISHAIIAFNFYTKIQSSIVLIIGLMCFIIAYAVGPGIIIWLVFSEYLPMPVRSQGIAIAGFINSLAGFLISSLFLYLGSIYGMGAIFFSCAIFSLIYGIIPILFLPDTNGKNLENIAQLFKNVR